MTIVFSTYDSIKNPFYGGGGAVSIHNVAKILAKEHDVVVLCGNYPGSKNEMIEGVEYKPVGYYFLGPRVSQLIYQFILPFKSLTKHDVWIESFTPPFSTAFMPLFTRKPVIGLIHLLGGNEKSKQYKLPFFIIERLGIKFYKYFIVQTQSSSEKIKKYNPKARIEIIPNGINPAYLKKQIINKSSYILYLGRFEIKQKGIDLLLEAIKKMKINNKLLFYFAGYGTKHELEFINTKIKELNLSSKIKIVGKAEGIKKEKLIQNSLFVVIPSRYETLSLVALEAFSFGKPVICFDIDGFNWIPSNSVIKVKKLNVDIFSQEMERLIDDPALRLKIGQNAREYVRNFDWNSISKKYADYVFQVNRANSK